MVQLKLDAKIHQKRGEGKRNGTYQVWALGVEVEGHRDDELAVACHDLWGIVPSEIGLSLREWRIQ
jgi:hypothetical protein